MSETTLYRKYRPATFEDVVGQDHIVTVLRGALEKGTISHAYLFAGSRGIGKTSIARIFARTLGVSDRDVYEIDAASNRGIDDIRALREEVHTLPFESKYKVYIVDEVHMLTKEAFNALLKTLEEPPAHVIFILATTEMEKLPDTIISRCQTFTFKRPSRQMLAEVVAKVAKAEGFSLEQASAELIALLADGSFRDAHGILQKVLVSSRDKKVSIAEVEQVTGAPRGELVMQILSGVAARDSNAVLTAYARAVEGGSSVRTLLMLLLERIRAVMLLRHAPDLRKDLAGEYPEDEFKELEALAKDAQSPVGAKALAVLLDAHPRILRAFMPDAALELALIEISAVEQ